MSAIGYPDFRRQYDYDQPPLITWPSGDVHNGIVQYGPFFVGNFAYIGGFLQNGTKSVKLSFQYFNDAVNLDALGTRTFLLDSAFAFGCHFRTPILGRFVRIAVTPASAGNYTLQGSVFGTNRPAAREFLPSGDDFTPLSAPALAAAGSALQIFGGYVTGPINISWVTGAQPCNAFLQAENGFGVFINIGLWPILANTILTVPFYAPAMPLQYGVTNTGAGAGPYTAQATSGGNAGS